MSARFGIKSKLNFNRVRISIASAEKIRSWSYGEVKKPETVNYRTIRPEPYGMFCSRIFGPVKDYECLCGKYKRIKYRGTICEKCGVEVTSSKERRERMGHIELATPVVHVWFLRSLPSTISILLDIPYKDIEKVLYFDAKIVSDSGVTTLKYAQLLSEDDYYNMQDNFGENSFEAHSGAEVIQTMLAELDLKGLSTTLRLELAAATSETKRKKIIKRLKLVESFLESGNNPKDMIMNVVPVIPPELRPLVILDGGRFATSDLNESYRRVISRNNRLRRLLELRAPEIIVRNEKRMLQEAVDTLFDNSRKSKSLKNASKRPFKSLADTIKGKHGRFRQNLLGKRVDYSGRSVIVVGPELELHQCGLPKKMALELFKPFIYAKLEMYGISTTLKSAKKMVENERPEVWDILDEVIQNHPVILNRAPSLHKLSIQAFEPVLIEGKAIQLHPLVCAAFNADFDGDSMAVHLPLSIEAQLEARILMMSINNILSPANGKPIIIPTQDIILGLYYLTLGFENSKEKAKYFVDVAEIEHAINANIITIHSKIITYRTLIDVDGNRLKKRVETTPGRVFLSELLEKNNSNISFEAINKVLNKKEVSKLIDMVYRYCGQRSTALFADQAMQLGFYYATKSGISIGKDDMLVPETKQKHLKESKSEVLQYENQYAEGLVTMGEKYNKVIDAWSRCTDKISADMMIAIANGKLDTNSSELTHVNQQTMNSIFMMADSGARGSAAQIRQLAGMRGLMTKPSGEIMEIPIVSNFKEGLTVLEYFNSTHGSRKGLADTALKTANSGYLTRKLVDVSQDCIVKEEDCHTDDGIVAKPIIENGVILVHLGERVLGRVAAVTVYNPSNGSILLHKDQMIDENIIELIDQAGIESLKIRSVLTCKEKSGVCAKCYGRDLATGDVVDTGEAVGIIAAQSIGEPGTQLTLRTFHIGGAAQKTSVQSNAISAYNGILRFVRKNTVTDSKGNKIVMSRNCEAVIADDSGYKKAEYKIPYGAKVFFDDGYTIKAGEKIAEWDPYTTPILTEKSGTTALVDLIDDVSVKDIQDEVTGVISRVVINSKQNTRGVADIRPRIVLLDAQGNVIILANNLEARYFLPVDAILNVQDAESVHAGDVIARIPKESSRSRDITGGLPRVVELFEARQPKDHAIISETNGYVQFGKDYKSKRRIIITDMEDKDKSFEYFIPRSKYLAVNEGDYISKGDMLVEGNSSPHDILRIMGVEALASYMINEVQQVYRLQGVAIDDKHIEVILRQMLQKVEIINPGGTTFLIGESVDREEFNTVNIKTMKLGYEIATACPILQGITRASLQTKSFFSAASFQETTRVLTEAAIAGKTDMLHGLKENIIVGRLIPAGTGFQYNKMKRSQIDKTKTNHIVDIAMDNNQIDNVN